MDKRVWRAHKHRILDGETPSIAADLKREGIFLIERKPQRRGFVATPDIKDELSVYMEGLVRDLKGQESLEKKDSIAKMEQEIDTVVDQLIGRTKSLKGTFKGPEASSIPPKVLREQKLLELGLAFINSAIRGDVPYGKAYLEAGLPINFQHPGTGMTALHYACSHIVRPPDYVDMLLAVEDCDLLIKDNQGRIPYEMIYRFGSDLDLAERIEQKTREQAEREGVTIDWDFGETYAPAPEEP